MKERPILMSAPMVRALLDGTKTQTRRIVKPQPVGIAGVNYGHDGYITIAETLPSGRGIRCPYGLIKDRLWVRETWRTLQKWDNVSPRIVMDDVDKIDYAASGFQRNPLWAWGKTRPGIFMPRWASRITLEITDVRVERLQEISEADAMAEGAEAVEYGDAFMIPEHMMRGGSFPTVAHAYGYQSLWESINGAGSWALNPWVWALTFRRVQP